MEKKMMVVIEGMVPVMLKWCIENSLSLQVKGLKFFDNFQFIWVEDSREE